MNKKLLCALLALSCHHVVMHADVYGRTFLTLRQRFEINLPERMNMFRERMDDRKDGKGGAFQFVGFYGQTTNAADIARYFSPNDKDYIIIGEDTSSVSINRTRDINAFHLGILTSPLDTEAINTGFTHLTFESVLTFCPQQKTYGLGVTYQQRLPNHFWLDVSAPIIAVKNNMNPTEHILNAGGEDVPTGYFGNALTALSPCNTDLHYGHITNRTLKKTRLAFIELRGGRDIIWEGPCRIGGFLGLLIPTGNKPCGYYLFEPIVGNNQHFEAMIGSYGNFEVMRDKDDRTLNALYNITTRYLFSNDQIRSFDLRGKPWSRYMKVWKNSNYGQEVSTDDWQSHLDYLINYSTLCAQIKPSAAFDISVGLNYKQKNLMLEFGYNAYARKAEDIYFTHAINGDVGLPALEYYLETSHVPYTDSKATPATPLFKISSGYSDQVINPSGSAQVPAYIPITTDDLDPYSASHPACLAYLVYGAIGYNWPELKFPLFVNGGISYEFSHDNTYIKRWLAWLKIGFSI